MRVCVIAFVIKKAAVRKGWRNTLNGLTLGQDHLGHLWRIPYYSALFVCLRLDRRGISKTPHQTTEFRAYTASLLS